MQEIARTCPFCGGDLPDSICLPIDDPCFDDIGHFIVVRDERRRVGRGTWLVLYELRRIYPRSATIERLLACVPARDHVVAAEREPKQVAVYIGFARELLPGTRWEIANVRGFGYRLALAAG